MKTYKGCAAFDDEDDLIYSPFYHGRRGAETDTLSKEILSYRCNVANPRDKHQEADLRRIPAGMQIFIWGHGNTSRACLAGDDGTTVDAEGIVDDFTKMKLPLAFDGNVILWSCFAGVAGGFGEALYVRLLGAGYRQLRLYAPSVATGGLAPFLDTAAYKGLIVYGNGTGSAAGALDSRIPPSIAVSMPGWNGTRNFCGIGDLRAYSTAQRLVAEV